MGQLVLSRERDESIAIGLPDGRTVEVMVVDIRGQKVRLGITADRDIIVDRWEIADRKRREAVKK